MNFIQLEFLLEELRGTVDGHWLRACRTKLKNKGLASGTARATAICRKAAEEKPRLVKNKGTANTPEKCGRYEGHLRSVSRRSA